MMIMDLAILLVTFLGWWVHVTRNQWRKRDLQRSGIRRSAWITWDVSFFLLAVLLSIYVLPSRELTYPPKMAFWRWFFFSRLVGYVSIPWRVSSYQQILRDLLLTKQAGLSLAFGVLFLGQKNPFFFDKAATGWDFPKKGSPRKLELNLYVRSGKLTYPLNNDGWFRCISYWNSPFLGDMLVFGDV